MKRMLSLLFVLMVFLSLFSGCTQKELIPIEYDNEVLIAKELPDPSFVWAGTFETPTKSAGLLIYSESCFFGIVDQHSIQVVESYNEEEYLLPEALSLNEYLAKLFKISRKELRQKFNLSLTRSSSKIWDDVTLFHFYVDEDNTNEEGNRTEFAGKYVFIECRPQNGEVYVQAISPEQYNGQENYIQASSSNIGRIGDRYYLSHGYYDLTEHSYECYKWTSEPPTCRMQSGIGSFASYFESYAEFSQNGELEAYWNEEMITRYSARYYVINDRIYAAFVYGSTSMQGQQEDVYAGSDLLLVMLDAETYELLYAEKYHSPNYYMGARGETISLYQKGADGFLYDWRILE